MTKISEIKDPVKRLAAFIIERQTIFDKRMAGEKPPWTKDKILRDGRFCNVFREQDKVTKWISKYWRTPNQREPDLWFAMCVARIHNLPSALTTLGFPVPWKPAYYLKTMHAIKAMGSKQFNGAYIVSTAGQRTEKVVYLLEEVFNPLWNNRERLRPKPDDTLNSYHMLLGQMNGFGSFMTGQVIADMKYVYPLKNASDWYTFAASGPGSRRGLNYVMGYDQDDAWREDDWRLELGRLRAKLNPLLTKAGFVEMHAQDTQNCLCEFSKYMRAVTTGQMPKQKFSSTNSYLHDDIDKAYGRGA